MSINNWTGSGRLGSNPELRHAGEHPVLNLRICANNRRKVKGEWTDVPLWMGVTIWGKRAEALARILSKGDLLMVEGPLQERTYTNKQGVEVKVTECSANEVDFATKSGGQQQQRSEPQGSQQQGGFADDSDELDTAF